MLLSFSPEGAFVLTLFELVLSGVSLVVLLWIRGREPVSRSRSAVGGLTLGYALLACGFLAQALYFRLAVWPPASEASADYWLLFLGEEARLLGVGALAGGYLIQRNGARLARAPVVAAVVLGVLAAARYSSDASLSSSSIVPLTATRLAELAVLGLGIFLLLRSQAMAPAAALVLVGSGRATALLAAASPSATEFCWAVEHATTLLGLTLLALLLERESARTSIRFFLRLNLTFLILASSLILLVTEIERRQFQEFAALNVQDLAEFVRGHMLYYTDRGESADRALAHDDVLRKVVAEFGRYPDLRRVRVSLSGRNMALGINDRGEIHQQFWSGERPVPPRVSPADFSVVPLVRVPIILRGDVAGAVELDHGLDRINEKIGWQMQVIFAVFTLFVAIASAVTGMLVVTAETTIRRQYIEIERTQRRLSLAERLASIGELADGVAHEINNPAGIVMARTDYLLSCTQGDTRYSEIRDDLETIRRQAQRIAKTVRDLLTFTRRTDLRGEVFEVRPVLDSAIALVEPLVAGRGIVVERHVSDGVPAACGDPGRLEQVFVNLLTNAVHATRASGRVVVRAEPRGDGSAIDIVVRDTGAGIDPDHLDRIFDPFFTTKAPGAGTGLGLSIAYGIVRDHGGTIDVTSTPGAGTEFRVTLPSAASCVGGGGARNGEVRLGLGRASR